MAGQISRSIYTAEKNLADNLLTGALNRIYYAIFYIVTALAYKYDYRTSKHSSLKGWFNKKFIYTDKVFDNKLYEIYDDAFTYRQDSDYDVTYKADEELVKELLKDTKIFIEAIKKNI